MVCLTVLYPNTPEAAFDLGYYLKTHMPTANETLKPLGLKRAEVTTGVGTLDGSPAPYAATCMLFFDTMEELQKAAMAAGPALIADIPNYCKAAPVFQIGEVVAD